MTSQSAFFGHTPLQINPAIFDFDMFDHLTMGDLLLQQEVLTLFREQVSATCAALKNPETAGKTHSLMHTLRGAAASVGATVIADLAKLWENGGRSDNVARERMEADLAREAARYFAETERILAPKFKILERQRQLAS